MKVWLFCGVMQTYSLLLNVSGIDRCRAKWEIRWKYDSCTRYRVRDALYCACKVYGWSFMSHGKKWWRQKMLFDCVVSTSSSSKPLPPPTTTNAYGVHSRESCNMKKLYSLFLSKFFSKAENCFEKKRKTIQTEQADVECWFKTYWKLAGILFHMLISLIANRDETSSVFSVSCLSLSLFCMYALNYNYIGWYIDHKLILWRINCFQLKLFWYN